MNLIKKYLELPLKTKIMIPWTLLWAIPYEIFRCLTCITYGILQLSIKEAIRYFDETE
jgi:hypothetical protein